MGATAALRRGGKHRGLAGKPKRRRFGLGRMGRKQGVEVWASLVHAKEWDTRTGAAAMVKPRCGSTGKVVCGAALLQSWRTGRRRRAN